MRRLDSDSFNRDVQDRIIELRAKANDITPDNVGAIYDKLSASFSDVNIVTPAEINGVAYGKLSEITSLLKSQKVEPLYIRRDYELTLERSRFTIEMPEGFDGRNAFVLAHYFTGGDTDLGLNYLKGNEIANSHLQENSTEYNMSINIVQNETIINVIANNILAGELLESSISLTVQVYAWRLV